LRASRVKFRDPILFDLIGRSWLNARTGFGQNYFRL
jgi:hypothetical protein